MNKEHKSTDIRRARRFANTFGFTDDLTVLIDVGAFEKSSNEIFPARNLGRRMI